MHFNPEALDISSGEYLPHWQCTHSVYHISFRLADSVPLYIREKWMNERERLVEVAREHGDPFNEIEKRLSYLYSERIERYLDVGYGECYLRNGEIAQVVYKTLVHFDKIRYNLHAWCIMPNHVHVIVEMIGNFDLSKIVHSWKSYSAHEANKILGRSGAFWQRDAYNHIIRSRKEYEFQIQYVWKNPEKACLKNWAWRWKLEMETIASK